MKKSRFNKRALALIALAPVLALPMGLVISCTGGAGADSASGVNIWNSKQVAEIGAAVNGSSAYNRWASNQMRDVVALFNNVEANKLINFDTVQNDANVLSSFSYLASNGVKTILANGAVQIDAIDRSIKSNTFDKDVNYLLLESTLNDPRVLSINFKYEQAGFLAGVIGAAKAYQIDPANAGVLTYGGPASVIIKAYMGGFQHGVKFFNDQLSTTPKVSLFKVGATEAEYFTSNFNAVPDDQFITRVTDWLNSPNVDVIFPVVGEQVSTIYDLINAGRGSAAAPGRYANKFLIGTGDIATPEATPNALEPIWLATATRQLATVATAALNALYNVTLVPPTNYFAPTSVTNAFFTSQITNNNPATLFGKTFTGGLTESFVGVLNESALATRLSPNWLALYNGAAKTAAASLPSVQFDINFVVS